MVLVLVLSNSIWKLAFQPEFLCSTIPSNAKLVYIPQSWVRMVFTLASVEQELTPALGLKLFLEERKGSTWANEWFKPGWFKIHVTCGSVKYGQKVGSCCELGATS